MLELEIKHFNETKTIYSNVKKINFDTECFLYIEFRDGEKQYVNERIIEKLKIIDKDEQC